MVTFPSPTHTWRRMARCMATYGGTADTALYAQLMQHTPKCSAAIATLQQQGVVFSARACQHWAVELCGSFEVTHPRYKSPLGADLPAATVLYDTVFNLLMPQE